jgi:hypothetical protein
MPITETLEKQLYKNCFQTTLKYPNRINSYNKKNGAEVFLIYKDSDITNFSDTEKAILLLFQNLDSKRKTLVISEILSKETA